MLCAVSSLPHGQAQALFKGNLTADLLYVCYGAVQFGLYNEWKAHIGQVWPWFWPPSRNPSSNLSLMISLRPELLMPF